MPRTSSPRHRLIAALVAGSIVALALAEGAHSVEARAVLALLVWTAVIAGLAFGLIPRSRPPQAALVVGALLAFLTALTLASVAWAGDDGIAVNEFVRVGGYLGIFILVVSVAAEDELRPWLAGLAAGIAMVAAIAVLSRLLPWLPGGDTELARALPAARGRLSFPIGYWNGLAALLAIGGVLLVWFAAFARHRAGRALAAAALPLIVLGIYLTSSRGGFVALGLGGAVVFALGPRRPAVAGSALLGALLGAALVAVTRGQPELLDGIEGGAATGQGLLVLAALIACMALAAALSPFVGRPLARIRVPPQRMRAAVAVGLVALAIGAVAADPASRIEDLTRAPASDGQVTAGVQRSGGSGRWQYWGAAVGALSSQPVHGIGAGAFGTYWNQHATIDQVATDAHSLYLEQLAELGPLGLLAVLGLLLVGPLRGVGDRSVFSDRSGIAAAAGVVAAGAVSAAIDWTWEIPAVFAPVLIALALLCGPVLVSIPRARIRSQLARAPRRRPAARPRWAIPAIACGLACLLVAGTALLGERNLDRSRAAARDNDLAEAAERARNANALEPWSAEPLLQLALVQESAGDVDAAYSTIDRAIERSPSDWRLWLARARIATLADRIPDAEASLERARSLNPRAAIFDELGVTEGTQSAP